MSSLSSGRRVMMLALAGGALWAGRLSAREITITVCQTTDLHGQITAVKALSGSTNSGGILRLAALLRQIRAECPEALLVDCGDLIQGSAESYLTHGRIMMEAVRELQYDALVPGNHEFDWGVTNLAGLYAAVGLPVLAANLGDNQSAEYTRPRELPVQPFLILNAAGIRVAVIGLTNPLIPRWIRPKQLGRLRFESSLSALRRVLPQVREKRPDIIILAVHQGYREGRDDPANEIRGIAAAFPELDLILGGHTHQALREVKVSGVAYTQPGAYGLWLSRARLVWDTDRRRLVRRSLELIAVTNGPPDPELTRRFQAVLAQTQAYLNEPIGEAAVDHSAISPVMGQSRIQSVIGHALAEAVNADAVFHGLLTKAEWHRGLIRRRDLWRVVPYENQIGVARLTLEEFRIILEENARYARSDQFRGVYGVTYELQLGAPEGSRVRNLKLTGPRPPAPDARIAVAFNSYDMASAGNRFPRLREMIEKPEAVLAETGIDTREAVAAYVRRHQPLDEPLAPGAGLVRK